MQFRESMMNRSLYSKFPIRNKVMTGKILRDRSFVSLDRQEASISLTPQSHCMSIDQTSYRKDLSFNDTTSVTVTKSPCDANSAKDPIASAKDIKMNVSLDSTANQEFDRPLETDYKISLKDFDGTSESCLKAKCAKRKKERNRKPSRIKREKSPDYFDLILNNCDSDVSAISMDDIDWIEDFENLDIAYSREKNDNMPHGAT